jgi:hypothetical protein
MSVSNPTKHKPEKQYRVFQNKRDLQKIEDFICESEKKIRDLKTMSLNLRCSRGYFLSM